MTKLFIIGNGFDMAHFTEEDSENNKTTSTEDFRHYLEGNGYKKSLSLPSKKQDMDGGESYDRAEQVSFVANLLKHSNGENWENFEEAMGNMDLNYCYPDAPVAVDSDGDPKPSANDNVGEDISTDMKETLSLIPDIFTAWLSATNIQNILPNERVKNLLKDDSDNNLFLNFNYTDTLQRLYAVPDSNVCHIHGRLGGTLVVGHGEAAAQYEVDFIEKYDLSGEAREKLTQLEIALKKDTAKALGQNIQFFNKLSNISEVYSYGFSYSKVDEIYVKEICRHISSNAIWYLNTYDEKDNNNRKFEGIIMACGFKGSFSRYK